uniref:Uncharacterized protein n=1 Tax=Cacopsylla melanoneura TaxID=428564 RepID=A0A8D8WTN2_9HEMI
MATLESELRETKIIKISSECKQDQINEQNGFSEREKCSQVPIFFFFRSVLVGASGFVTLAVTQLLELAPLPLELEPPPLELAPPPLVLAQPPLERPPPLEPGPLPLEPVRPLPLVQSSSPHPTPPTFHAMSPPPDSNLF